MGGIFDQMKDEHQQEIEELEVELAQYTATYNGIKNYNANRTIRGGMLRVLEFILYFSAGACLLAFFWVETQDMKLWSGLLEKGEPLSLISGALVSANVLAWKLLAASLVIVSLALRWLLGRIRNKNRVLREQAELLKNILNKLGTNLYKLKQTQELFQSLNKNEERHPEPMFEAV